MKDEVSNEGVCVHVGPRWEAERMSEAKGLSQEETHGVGEVKGDKANRDQKARKTVF